MVAALSIGVGGMIGAGIFSVLGVVAGISGAALPLSFAIGGLVAGLAAYGYVALGKRFPSVGGAVTFLVHGYGEGVASGSLNLFQYFSYIITIALYATGFAAYAATFIHLPPKAWAVGVVLAFTAVNFLGNRIMGRAESVIVIIKVAILAMFIVAAFVALPGNGLTRLSPATWPGPLAIFTGAGVLYLMPALLRFLSVILGGCAPPPPLPTVRQRRRPSRRPPLDLSVSRRPPTDRLPYYGWVNRGPGRVSEDLPVPRPRQRGPLGGDAGGLAHVHWSLVAHLARWPREVDGGLQRPRRGTPGMAGGTGARPHHGGAGRYD